VLFAEIRKYISYVIMQKILQTTDELWTPPLYINCLVP